MDACFEAYGGELIGYVTQLTVTGCQGPVEVLTGFDLNGSILAVQPGGQSFKETPGLGSKVQEAKFRDQFAGLSVPLKLKENVDAVSGATISSASVVSAVNASGYFLQKLVSPAADLDLPEDQQFGGVIPGATTKEEVTPTPEGVDALYTSDAGAVVYVTGKGRNGDIQVQVASDGVYTPTLAFPGDSVRVNGLSFTFNEPVEYPGLRIKKTPTVVNALLVAAFALMTAGLYLTFFVQPVLVKLDAEGYAVGGPKPEGMRMELSLLLLIVRALPRGLADRRRAADDLPRPVLRRAHPRGLRRRAVSVPTQAGGYGRAAPAPSRGTQRRQDGMVRGHRRAGGAVHLRRHQHADARAAFLRLSEKAYWATQLF